MGDITVDVDLQHSPHRVWQALTDRRLLADWFMQTDLEPRPGAVGRAFPSGIPGFAGPFDVEIVEVEEERRLVMRWRGDQIHAEVRWELEQAAGGSKLRISQTGFLGVNGTLRRRELRRAYQQIFGEQLPAVLERIAQGEVDLDGEQVAPHSAIPRQRAKQQLAGVARAPADVHHVANELPSAAPPPPVHPADFQDPSDPWALSDPSVSAGVALPKIGVAEEERGELTPPRHGLIGRLSAAFPVQERVRAAAITVTAALIMVTVGWLWSTRPMHSDAPPGPISVETHVPGVGVQPAPQSPQPTAGATGGPGVVVPGGGSGSPQPTTTGAAGGQPSAEPTGEPLLQPALTAEYATQSSTDLFGYRVSVTVTVHNPGTTPHSGWTVVLGIPDDAKIDSSSSSVNAQKNGTKVTITPKEDVSSVVNAGSDIVFTLTFSGSSVLGIGSGGVSSCTIDSDPCTKA